MKRRQPCAEGNGRSDKVRSAPPIPPACHNQKKHEGSNQPGLLHQHQHHAYPGSLGIFALQKQQQSKQGKHHRRHIELRHEALHIEERRGE
jgi:hypothetical protein